MRKKIIYSAIMFIAFMGIGVNAQNQKVVAVATFDVAGNACTASEADAVTELFISELAGTGFVTVVDRNSFNKILDEMQFQLSDWSNPRKTVQLGNMTNAQVICRGQISKLGNTFHLSSTIIDVKTANILSSSKVRFSQIDNVYDVLPQFTKNIVKVFAPPAPPEPPKLGGKGPGGGTVFRVEYGWAMEISEPIGRTSWNNAQQMCSNYNGGGFRDWYLPSKDELNMSYNALRRFGIQFGNEWHWTSTTGAWGKAWGTNFSVGYDEYPSAIGVVRAIRGFSY